MRTEDTRWLLYSRVNAEGRLSVTTYVMKGAPAGSIVKMVVSVPLVPYGAHGEKLQKKRRFIVDGRNMSERKFEEYLSEFNRRTCLCK